MTAQFSLSCQRPKYYFSIFISYLTLSQQQEIQRGNWCASQFHQNWWKIMSFNVLRKPVCRFFPIVPHAGYSLINITVPLFAVHWGRLEYFALISKAFLCTSNILSAGQIPRKRIPGDVHFSSSGNALPNGPLGRLAAFCPPASELCSGACVHGASPVTAALVALSLHNLLTHLAHSRTTNFYVTGAVSYSLWIPGSSAEPNRAQKNSVGSYNLQNEIGFSGFLVPLCHSVLCIVSNRQWY